MRTTCYEIGGVPDKDGRQPFTLYWVGRVGRNGTEIGVRAQEFHARLEHYRESSTRHGDEFVEVKSHEEAREVLKARGEL